MFTTTSTAPLALFRSAASQWCTHAPENLCVTCGGLQAREKERGVTILRRGARVGEA